MSDQDFRERVLSSIEDLKRMDAELKRMFERMDDKIEHMNTQTNNRLLAVEKDVGELRSDVKWIRGKLEGRQEAKADKDAKAAIWIALGSALAAIVSLVKSFWT